MSQANVETIERMLAEAKHDRSALLPILDDHVEFEVWEKGGPVFRGPREVAGFFNDWTEMFDEWGYEADEVLDAGDSVVVLIHQWGRGAGSGATVDQRFWQVWTLHDGKVQRVRHYRDRAEALEPVGLSE
jgi:ketosteroid isomerase-like protein